MLPDLKKDAIYVRLSLFPKFLRCEVEYDVTGLPNKAQARGITQPRTNLIREPCTLEIKAIFAVNE